MAEHDPHDRMAAGDRGGHGTEGQDGPDSEAPPGQCEVLGGETAPDGSPVVVADAAPGARSGAVVSAAGLTIRPEGAARITALGQADRGTVAVNGDGTVTYRPDDGFAGPDAFAFEFEDAGGDILRSTVRLEVAPGVEEAAPAPEAGADEAVVVAVTDGAHGTVRRDDRGALIYRPDADFVGTDRFTYTLRDAAGDEEVHTVLVRVDEEGRATLAVERGRHAAEGLGAAGE